MKIVVLGASGQIGSPIFEGLSATQEVIGTSRSSSNKLLQFDPFKDDWSALGNADVVINCISQIAASQSFSFELIHVGVTKFMIDNRFKIGNPRLIQISALGASINSEIEFLKTKGVADDMLLHHQDTFVVRPSIVCTHRTMIVRKLLMIAKMSRYTGGVLFVPKGFLSTKVQPVMTNDLVNTVTLLCKGEHPHIVDAVGPDRLSFSDLFVILQKSQKKKLKFVEVPKSISDFFLGNGLPGLLNKEQYKLLFQDNVGDAVVLERVLRKKLQSPLDYFEKAFTDAYN